MAHRGLSELKVVGSMHERKAVMAELADAFVALPGGLGTLEEFSEAATWTQLGLHRKACGLLNVEGYYDALLALLDRAVADGFVRPAHRAIILADADPGVLLDRLAQGEPPALHKWIDRDRPLRPVGFARRQVRRGCGRNQILGDSDPQRRRNRPPSARSGDFTGVLAPSALARCVLPTTSITGPEYRYRIVRIAQRPGGGAHMKRRVILWLAAIALIAGPAAAQQQAGQIFGKVTDTTGAVLPGATVTLSGNVLLQPQVAITSATGTYQFPQLAVGVYTVQFDLAGFKTVVREGIRIEIGFNAQINEQLQVS